MMTPERRARLDALAAVSRSPCRESCDLEYELELLLALEDAIAEIDRLTAENARLNGFMDEIEAKIKETASLAAELERRSKA